MIQLVTDSSSMLPATLQQRSGISVVPMTIIVDGVEYEETAMDASWFYEQLTAGATVTTSAPSPGSLLAAYQTAADTGADGVVSIHTGSAYSATVAAANTAADLSPIPVAVVDTGLASFPVALCVWAAAEALSGGELAHAVDAAQTTAASTGSVFVVGVPELARRGGRFVGVSDALQTTSVLELTAKGMSEVATVDNLDTAIETMADHVTQLAAERPLRVGVGDAQRPDMGAVLATRLHGVPGVSRLVRYDVGPSVGAHTGAGSVGIVYAPL